MSTTTEPLSAHEHAATFTKKMRTVALVIVSLAFVMDLLDSTIVNIAIPAIKSNLGASYSAIQWLLAGYSLAFALLLVTGGRMGDVFGYKKLFMIGIGGFTVASLLSGLAGNPGMLIAARLLQGSMAALMVPQVMSLMQIMYKPEERGAINGLFGALGGLAASLGPIIGGLLIKANVLHLDWRPIFLINVPIGIFGFLAAAKYLPDGKSPHPLKLDIVGTGLIMIAMLLLIYPLIQGRDLGWPTWSYVMIAASIPVFGIFAWWQKKKDKLDGSALVQPELFKNRSFAIGLTINLVFEMAMIAFFLTFALLVQLGLGYSAIHAALTGLPTAFGIALTMGIMGPKIIPKLGRYALTIGTLVMSAGLAITTAVIFRYSTGIHSWQFIPGLLIVGIGMGMVFASLFAAVLNGVDTKHAGSASGLLNALQQVGAAIGIALIGVVFFGQLGHSATSSFESVKPQLYSSLSTLQVPVEAQAGIVQGAERCFVDRSKQKDSAILPDSCKQGNTANFDPAIGNIIGSEARQANTNNFDNAFRWSVIYEVAVLVLTFSLTFLLPRRFKAEAYSEV